MNLVSPLRSLISSFECIDLKEAKSSSSVSKQQNSFKTRAMQEQIPLSNSPFLRHPQSIRLTPLFIRLSLQLSPLLSLLLCMTLSHSCFVPVSVHLSPSPSP